MSNILFSSGALQSRVLTTREIHRSCAIYYVKVYFTPHKQDIHNVLELSSVISFCSQLYSQVTSYYCRCVTKRSNNHNNLLEIHEPI